MVKWICLDCEHEWKHLLVNPPTYCINCWNIKLRKKGPNLGDMLAEFQKEALIKDFVEKLQKRHPLSEQDAKSLAKVCIECVVTVDEVLFLFTSPSNTSSTAEFIKHFLSES